MNEIIDLHQFARLVRHALAALYDYPRLQGLPLARLLAGDQPEPARGPALHHLLLQAIAELKPASPSVSSPAYRRYQYLYLRYVDVRSIADVADLIGVSLRQARRDHHDAVDVLASRLYEIYQARRLGEAQAPRDASERPGSVEAILATEAERIGLLDRPGPTNCEEVIASAIETLTPLAATRGIALRQIPTHRSGVTPIDRALARQILINAIGYTLSVVDHGEIAIASEVSPSGVEIRIELSSRPAATEGDARLAVCRHLASLVHGDIQLRWSGEAVQIQISLPGARPATVLVVDDNPDVRQLFRRYLGGGLYRIVEASGFDEALDAVRDVQPDVMTVDVMLPVRDGWELLQRVKQDARCAEIPVIVCSVLRERDLAFALGAGDFLEKPVTQQGLLTAIARQMGRRIRTPHPTLPEGTAMPPVR